MAGVVRKEFSTQNVPISRVVIYRDRAEITRTLDFKADVAEHEIVLKGVPGDLDRASLRVDGRGSAVITDVNLATSYTSRGTSPDYDEKLKNLRAIYEEALKKKTLEQQELERIKQETKFWDNCLESLSKEAFAVRNGQSYPVTPETTNNLASFLTVHAAKIRETGERVLNQEKVFKAAEDDFNAAWSNLSQHENGSSTGPSNDITVLLQATHPGPLELTFRYVSFNASWNPKYDVRVTEDQKKITIHYYAIINQRTGEEWNELPLSLSTAVPSLGGTIPLLGTKQVSIRQEQPIPTAYGFGAAPQYMRAKRATVAMNAVMASEPVMEMAVTHQVTSVQESGINTQFEITKPTTIPTDGSDHKVTVAVIELTPKKIQYKSIPKKAALAFLEARADNTSQYPILAGSASVFFGTSFVANVELKTTSPQEEFACSLGADPAVKVTYRPVRRFNEQTGMINKTKVVTYSQDVEVYNTRAEPVSIVVIDQVPLSTDEKLKVVLLEPALTREKPEGKGYLLNADNNLEHRFDVKERSKYSFTIKYRLEYPSDKEIEETELPPTA